MAGITENFYLANSRGFRRGEEGRKRIIMNRFIVTNNDKNYHDNDTNNDNDINNNDNNNHDAIGLL